MVHVDRLIAYPFKSLDGCERDTVRLTTGGAFVGDRAYAMFEAGIDPAEASVSGGGGYVNGKSDDAVHRIRASYEAAGDDDATPTRVTVETPQQESTSFDLPADTDALETWLEGHFGYGVQVARTEVGGYPDDTEAFGPTIVSQATLAEVASWFDGISPEEMCRRLRPSVVVDGCPAFWEDRLFADPDSRVRFRIGDIELLGVNPTQRCVVPLRDPDTGEQYPGFRETFLTERRRTLPEWSGGEWFDHDFRLMVNTLTPPGSIGETIAADDSVAILETVDAKSA